MKFKKVLCLVTSIVMLSNFCLPVSAMSKKRRDKRKLSVCCAGALDKILERNKEKQVVIERLKSKLTSLPKASKPSSDSLKVDQGSESAPKKSVESAAAALTQKSEEKQVEKVVFGSPQSSSSTKSEETEGRDDLIYPEEFYQEVLGIHPMRGELAFIGPDDIDSAFPERVCRDSVYYVVSEKLKTYYQLWRNIEFKLMTLKRTLPKGEYDYIHKNWWETSTQFHINVFASFPDYIKYAYRRALSYPDVVFGQDDYQVKAIEHMQKEWSLASKPFDMAILVGGGPLFGQKQKKILMQPLKWRIAFGVNFKCILEHIHLND